MKVFIVDDSAVVRERIVDMLTDFEEIEIVGQAQNSLEAIQLIRISKPDVVILDIRMPGGGGISALQTIKENDLVPVVIILTNYPYPQYRKKCLEIGADFFFDKSSESGKITEVLKQLIQSPNKRSIPGTIARV